MNDSSSDEFDLESFWYAALLATTSWKSCRGPTPTWPTYICELMERCLLVYLYIVSLALATCRPRSLSAEELRGL
eukprot:CAMPEP_0206525436 /NCGR_PEP_ID=MMETSP0324_2-20121206/68730_1 /ASSEMBLY_ACC=CAM_ASM_000836 /TAXON_ID=2866 /ORGANISM="Crypthecodinium cohnii, Strain Seligo" /LENGTH=74 /DNA_ID=CAMNT_0054020097 /DNA_START=283 /DNA_END=507 /DNA_ORIENTATION=+